MTNTFRSCTVQVHDGRPGWNRALTDEWGYGEVVTHTRTRTPLHIGDLVRLPDGTSWPVVTTREWHSGLGWHQRVVVGDRCAAQVA